MDNATAQADVSQVWLSVGSVLTHWATTQPVSFQEHCRSGRRLMGISGDLNGDVWAALGGDGQSYLVR